MGRRSREHLHAGKRRPPSRTTPKAATASITTKTQTELRQDEPPAPGKKTSAARAADSPDRGPEETKPTRSAPPWWRSRRWRVEGPPGHGWRAHVGAVRRPTGRRLYHGASWGGDLRTTDSGHGRMTFPCRFARALEQLPLLSVIDGLSRSPGIGSAPGLWRPGRFSHRRERPRRRVTSITHVAIGAQPVLPSSAGNDGVENQLGPLARIARGRCRALGRLVGRRARLMIHRRVRVESDPSSTGASHLGWRLGACSHRPIAWRSPGVGRSGCRDPLAPTCDAVVNMM